MKGHFVQPLVSLLFMAAGAASVMLTLFGECLSLSERIALFTVAITGFCLYFLFRRLGFRPF